MQLTTFPCRSFAGACCSAVEWSLDERPSQSHQNSVVASVADSFWRCSRLNGAARLNRSTYLVVKVTKGLEDEDLGWPSYVTQYTKPATDSADDKRGFHVPSSWRRISHQSTPSWKMQCSRWETKKTAWKTLRELRKEHWSSLLKFAKNSKRF